MYFNNSKKNERAFFLPDPNVKTIHYSQIKILIKNHKQTNESKS